MFTVLLTFHLLLCLTLIGLVLLQQGKGADMGAAFGGGGNNTVFGASGGADFITKVTTWSAILFMVTSILLVRNYVSMGSELMPSAETSGGSPLAGSVMDGLEQKGKASAPASAVPPVSSAPSLDNSAVPAAAAPAAKAPAAKDNAAAKAPAGKSANAASAGAQTKEEPKK